MDADLRQLLIDADSVCSWVVARHSKHIDPESVEQLASVSHRARKLYQANNRQESDGAE